MCTQRRRKTRDNLGKLRKETTLTEIVASGGHTRVANVYICDTERVDIIDLFAFSALCHNTHLSKALLYPLPQLFSLTLFLHKHTLFQYSYLTYKYQ